jgi:flagellar biogenesis protein FliO
MTQFDTGSQAPMGDSGSGEFGIAGEPPAWPKVVGIISIVWGSLGIVCNVCGLAGPAMSNLFVNMVPPEQREQMKQQMAASRNPLSIGLSAVGLLVAILLIAAGIQTLRRQASGRPMHLLWGVLGIVLAIAGGAVALANMKTQMASMPQQSSPQAQQMATTFGYVGAACAVVFFMIWPVFVLIWFGPLGKRPEAGVREEPLV